MGVLNEIIVLDFYLEQIEKDEINFLKNRDSYKDKIKKLIQELKEEAIIHNKIEICKKLWKVLFESAMSFIDPDKRGYDKLFEYFDKFVKFEELIFASDSFYRDHTMHCLWVYFLGEYVKRHEEFEFLVRDMENIKEGHTKLCEMYKGGNYDGIFDTCIYMMENIMKMHEFEDALRCVSILTHDLGYPIKKVSKINSCIREVLPYFNINSYDEFNFYYNEVQQKYIEEFIEILSLELSVGENMILDELIDDIPTIMKIFTEDGINKEELSKLNNRQRIILKRNIAFKMRGERNIDKSLRYYSDFENYNHGIMSAYLLMKNIKSFQNSNFKYSRLDDMNIDSKDIMTLACKQSILTAIADHTNDTYQIKSIDELSPFLILMDELEEFSRISRANQNRQFINEFCKTNIYTEEGYLRIDFTFDNTDIDNLSPELAFRGRCKRFLTLFDIFNLKEELKIKLRCIGDLPYNKNVYELEIRRKFANITINGEEKNIPEYLSSSQFYSKEEYSA